MEFLLPEILESLYRQSGLPPARVMREVERMSAAYERGETPPIDNDSVALAYTLYFLPEHFLKPFLVVSELLARGLLKTDGQLHVADIGAGPGTATWAVIEALRTVGDNRCVQTALIDRSKNLLKTAATIAAGYGHAVTVSAFEGELSTASIPSTNVAFICNALSEVDGPEPQMDVLNRALQAVGDTGAVVVIEPDSARGAAVAAALWSCFGPKIIAPSAAPHAFDVAVPVPAALQRVVTARHSRQKFYWAVLSNAPRAPHAGLFRIVGPFRKLKWGFQAAACGESGRLCVLVRSKSKEDRRKLEAIGAADLVTMDVRDPGSGRIEFESAEPISVVHSFAAPALRLGS
jgi:hypothetical protein